MTARPYLNKYPTASEFLRGLAEHVRYPGFGSLESYRMELAENLHRAANSTDERIAEMQKKIDSLTTENVELLAKRLA